MLKQLKKIGIDTFLLLLLLMVLLAYLFPEFGARKGNLSLKNLSNWGVALIFFFYGLRLSPKQLKVGLSNWKLHLLIHFSTFVIFPVLILFFRFFFNSYENQELWLGIFYLSTLPSTVSSSVVMVSIAKGNLPAAIFNASISSLLGVFITPLWMSLVLAANPESMELKDIIIKLVIQVIIPVIFGITLHKFLGKYAEKYKVLLKKFDQSVILIIVYTAFCDSFIENAFSGFGIIRLSALIVGMLTLFFIVYFIINFISNLLHFNREDKITALFCGSKKSLVHGSVMSKVLFLNFPSVGVILLPTMIYHATQLIVVSIIAQKMGREVGNQEK